MKLRTDVIDDYEDFEELRPNWEALYLIDPDAQFFLSWDWLSQLFMREPDRIFFILAVRPDAENSDYVAFSRFA